MKRILLFALVALTWAACGNKTNKADDADSTAVSDSVGIVEELNDTTPLPMFLYYMNPTYMQTIYWTGVEKPKKDKDNADYFDGIYASWSLQDMSRRNAAGYTKMLVRDKWVDIKYIGELLKNPDGEVMYGGELHSRPSIPSPGLKYAFVNPKDAPKKDYDYGEFNIIVHQDYLASRKMLKCTYMESVKPLPQAIVKKMEQQYNMKATRSQLCAKFDDGYTQGYIQFAGEYKGAPKDNDRDYKKALALELIIKGDSIFTEEVIGYYDEESKSCTWNADDGGDYCSVGIHAVFEGPKGLEICYERGAPESRTVGIWFLRDGKIDNLQYECYHSMIDEQTPLWKKDIAQMRKLFSNSSKGTLSKYQFLYLDNDNVEEIWMRSNDDTHGAIFTFKDRKPQLVAIEDDKTGIAFYQGNGKGAIKITSENGNFTTTKFYVLKGSQVIERFTMQELDGEITDSKLNGKTLTKWEAAEYLDKTPSDEYKTYPYWTDIEQ